MVAKRLVVILGLLVILGGTILFSDFINALDDPQSLSIVYVADRDFATDVWGNVIAELQIGGHFRRYPPPAELIDWNYWLAFNTECFYIEGLDETTNNHVRPDSNNYDVVWIGTVYYYDLYAYPNNGGIDPKYPTPYASVSYTHLTLPTILLV